MRGGWVSSFPFRGCIVKPVKVPCLFIRHPHFPPYLVSHPPPPATPGGNAAWFLRSAGCTVLAAQVKSVPTCWQ